MQEIPFEALPSQEISVQVDGANYVLRFYTSGTVMLVDITRDNIPLITGSRVLAGELIIPYRYQENGNFLMLTDGGVLPDYTIPMTLVYMSDEELAVIRAA